MCYQRRSAGVVRYRAVRESSDNELVVGLVIPAVRDRTTTFRSQITKILIMPLERERPIDAQRRPCVQSVARTREAGQSLVKYP